MKKVLLVLIIVLTLVLSGCDEVVTSNDSNELARGDFHYVSRQNNIFYEESLENHDWVQIDTHDANQTWLCSDILSINVYGNTLEIIDDDYNVYVINGNWQMEFYDYKEETE